MEIMRFLLKRVSFLLLIAFDTSLFNEGLTIAEHCPIDVTVECALELLTQIENKTSQELPQKCVEYYMDLVLNITSLVSDNATHQDLTVYGNNVLDITEKLVSTLVRKTDDIQSMNISLRSLEIQVIEFGLNSTLSKIPSLTTTTASMDIEFTEILNDCNVAVALMSYTNMGGILNASFFKTFVSTEKNIISPVVSVTLYPFSGFTTNIHEVIFTFKHVNEFDPEGVLSCVYWNKIEWDEDVCINTEMNRTHTVCSCDRLGTFAVIMQTYSELMYDFWTIFRTASVAVGMMFLSLSILTLAIYLPHKKVTNMTLINLCMMLLLAMLLRLLTIHVRSYICSRKHLFTVLEGVLLFLYLSASMWMFNKAVLFFIFVKNLSNFRSRQEEGLNCKWLIMIGYLIPLVLMVVYGIVYRGIYTGFICCTNMSDRDTYFLPFYIIFASILILYIITIIIVIVNLIRMNNQNVLRSNCNDTKLIITVTFKSLAQFFINGCPWIIYFLPRDHTGFFVLNLICIQQGAFIFLFHCLLSSEVRQQYKKRLCAICCLKNHSSAAEDVQEPQGTT